MSDLLKKILTCFLLLWTNLAHTSPLKCVGLEQVSWSKVNVIVDRESYEIPSLEYFSSIGPILLMLHIVRVLR